LSQIRKSFAAHLQDKKWDDKFKKWELQNKKTLASQRKYGKSNSRSPVDRTRKATPVKLSSY
jgi:hypothetical protein